MRLWRFPCAMQHVVMRSVRETGFRFFLRFTVMDGSANDRTAWVYILTNRPRGVLYVGATTHLQQRIWQHKLGVGNRFTARHSLKYLIHVEAHQDVRTALERENVLKNWRRAWKLQLIEAGNPDWADLYRKISE